MLTRPMLTRLNQLVQLFKHRFWFVMSASVVFAITYYAVQLVAMVLKFGQLPNYTRLYNWPSNVMRIVESTPSIKDTLIIIKAEWLFEIGFMNYEYGFGISQWSLYLSPAKTLAVMLLGMMFALLFLSLRRDTDKQCSVPKVPCAVTGGVAATLVSFSLLSLSWVVCCATPTWVVGLAMLGLSASTSIWLEPIGIWLNALGFVAIVLALLAAQPSGDKSRRAHAENRLVNASF